MTALVNLDNVEKRKEVPDFAPRRIQLSNEEISKMLHFQGSKWTATQIGGQ